MGMLLARHRQHNEARVMAEAKRRIEEMRKTQFELEATTDEPEPPAPKPTNKKAK